MLEDKNRITIFILMQRVPNLNRNRFHYRLRCCKKIRIFRFLFHFFSAGIKISWNCADLVLQRRSIAGERYNFRVVWKKYQNKSGKSDFFTGPKNIIGPLPLRFLRCWSEYLIQSSQKKFDVKYVQNQYLVQIWTEPMIYVNDFAPLLPFSRFWGLFYSRISGV